MEQKSRSRSKPTSQKSKAKNSGNFQLRTITPLTSNQKVFFDIYDDYQAISLTGSAGTGKSYIALYKALEEYEIDDTIKSVKIVRSAVQGRQIGHMPGDAAEKLSYYEGPYADIVNDLYGRADAYSLMRQKNLISFDSTSFLRGLTFDNCVIVLDEAQNLNDIELFTILTRVGENCKIIICGDVRQDDLTTERYKETSGYSRALAVLSSMSSAKSIQFSPSDIVRSDFVKAFIIAYEGYGKKENDLKGTLQLLNS